MGVLFCGEHLRCAPGWGWPIGPAPCSALALHEQVAPGVFRVGKGHGAFDDLAHHQHVVGDGVLVFQGERAFVGGDDAVVGALDVFQRTTRPYLGDVSAYSLINSGAGLRFGVPVTETDTVFVGVNAEQTEIREGTGLPDAYRRYAEKFGATSTAVPLTLGWARDGRDSALVPTRGSLDGMEGVFMLSL